MHDFLTFLAHHWLLTTGFIIVLLLLIIEESRSKAFGGQGITPQDTTTLINREQALVVDIRLQEAYAAGHIVGALHIPHQTFDAQLEKLAKYKEKPVIIVCGNGQTSGNLAAKLRKQGFLKVYALSGGVQAWRAANLPLTKA